ncbi:MAG: organoarsenical effux MFS transporter ArsJ [Kofleriaceae bacterium]|nr:organoarsenical effux MFS transporter ArsJ [Kofleriaceae bacterium]
MSERQQLRSYMVVTAAYWLFTLTDGALRMLVLGYFHALGYSPFQLASLFFLYELCGVLTNLLGGWIGSRAGLKLTLGIGLGLQLLALTLLSGLSSQWSEIVQISWVIIAQGMSGIAKDFTKISAKSAIKALVPANQNSVLFRWVAILTGSKNTLKGVGFFLGGFLLSTIGFRQSLWGMAGGIALALVGISIFLPRAMGKSSIKHALADALKIPRSITILAAARLFLFCARDVWFVVGLPVFLSEVLGWTFLGVGTYLALWVIGYGMIQAFTPKLLPRLGQDTNNDARSAQLWGAILALIPLAIYILLRLQYPPQIVVLAGLAVFAVLFAINSAIHSYLILAYSDPDRTTLNVGFYYMANAMGRLMGTLLSELLYQWGGLQVCLLTASAMVALSVSIAIALPDTRKHAG